MAAGFDSRLELMPESESLAISRSAILRETSHVLSSKPFRTSKQCQNFLRYVVLQSVDGSDESLKERVIGAAVLERSPDYNTADDPVVRIRAADVRKRLAMYCQDEGQSANIRITVRPGHRLWRFPDHARRVDRRVQQQLDAGAERQDAVSVRHAQGEKGIEGAGHFWQTDYSKDGAPREDYALITREISPKSRAFQFEGKFSF